MDVDVFTRLQVTGSSIRPTRRLKVALVQDPPDRHLTSLKVVPSIGSPARRSTRLTRLKGCRLLGHLLAVRRDCYIAGSELYPPGQTYLLALPVETSTSYASRGSTAGIIQPTKGLTKTCIRILDLEVSALYLVISFLWDGLYCVAPFHFPISSIQLPSDLNRRASNCFAKF